MSLLSTSELEKKFRSHITFYNKKVTRGVLVLCIYSSFYEEYYSNPSKEGRALPARRAVERAHFLDSFSTNKSSKTFSSLTPTVRLSRCTYFITFNNKKLKLGSRARPAGPATLITFFYIIKYFTHLYNFPFSIEWHMIHIQIRTFCVGIFGTFSLLNADNYFILPLYNLLFNSLA